MFDLKERWQRFVRGYSGSDCWGLNYWFSETLPKMIITLRNYKHGYPELEFEEVDNFSIEWIEEAAKDIIKSNVESDLDEELDLKDGFDRWQLILTRIAWCLQQASEEITEIENEYKKEYNKQVWGDDSDIENNWTFKRWWNKHHVVSKYDKKGKPLLYRLVTNEPDPEIKEKYWKREEEIANYREECKNEAFDLLKKYFWDLWD